MSTVKKSTCERYDVRDGFDNWAVIMLDEAGGVVSIQSAYGNWGYHWTHHGCKSLKHFLPKMDRWYLVHKLTDGRKDFDADATLKQFTKLAKETIIEKRRERSFSMLAVAAPPTRARGSGRSDLAVGVLHAGGNRPGRQGGRGQTQTSPPFQGPITGSLA